MIFFPLSIYFKHEETALRKAKNIDLFHLIYLSSQWFDQEGRSLKETRRNQALNYWKLREDIIILSNNQKD